jgi:hypothetical protein
VLEAVARRDAEALRALALNEQEFREHVWPELPSARPERNLPFAYVWGDLRQKSEQGLAAMLAKHGGAPYQLTEVTFEGEPTRYSSYTVHRDTTLTVRDARGAVVTLRLYGSTFEKDGAYKVFSYVVD